MQTKPITSPLESVTFTVTPRVALTKRPVGAMHWQMATSFGTEQMRHWKSCEGTAKMTPNPPRNECEGETGLRGCFGPSQAAVCWMLAKPNPAKPKLGIGKELFLPLLLFLLPSPPCFFLPLTPADICLMNVKAFRVAKEKRMRQIAFILLPLMGAHLDKSSWILMEAFLEISGLWCEIWTWRRGDMCATCCKPHSWWVLCIHFPQ